MKNVRLTALAEFDLIEAQDFYAPGGDWVLDHFMRSINNALDDKLRRLRFLHDQRPVFIRCDNHIVGIQVLRLVPEVQHPCQAARHSRRVLNLERKRQPAVEIHAVNVLCHIYCVWERACRRRRYEQRALRSPPRRGRTRASRTMPASSTPSAFSFCGALGEHALPAHRRIGLWRSLGTNR